MLGDDNKTQHADDKSGGPQPPGDFERGTDRVFPVRLAAYKPLLRAWLSGLLYALTQRTALPDHRTLMLCDEIASLGPMDAFLMTSTMMRGWGLTLWSFWQNPSQLEIYGHQARTIVDNAGVLQLFGARNWRVAQDFAALVGGVDPDAIMAMPRDGGFCRSLTRGEEFEQPAVFRAGVLVKQPEQDAGKLGAGIFGGQAAADD
jgi:TraM recognition site of TraD and TraG